MEKPKKNSTEAFTKLTPEQMAIKAYVQVKLMENYISENKKSGGKKDKASLEQDWINKNAANFRIIFEENLSEFMSKKYADDRDALVAVVEGMLANS